MQKTKTNHHRELRYFKAKEVSPQRHRGKGEKKQINGAATPTRLKLTKM
jgi:hypothetical protein